MVGIEFRVQSSEFRVQSGDWEVLLCRIDAFSTAFPRCPEELASRQPGGLSSIRFTTWASATDNRI